MDGRAINAGLEIAPDRRAPDEYHMQHPEVNYARYMHSLEFASIKNDFEIARIDEDWAALIAAR